jgi:hypothetical protein
MFDIPEKYKVDFEIAMKDFIPKDVKPNDKKRIQSAVKSAVLSYQIQGEEIPSMVNEDYNCSVIQFYDIQLTSIKEAVFIANVYQQMIKNLCVLRLYDSAKEQFSFGLKRLSKTANNEVVLEDSFYTSLFPTMLPDKKKRMFMKYASYNKILNKSSKVDYYTELYTKGYVVENINIAPNLNMFLENHIWYDKNKVNQIRKVMLHLIKLQNDISKELVSKKRVEINDLIRYDLDEIKRLETE